MLCRLLLQYARVQQSCKYLIKKWPKEDSGHAGHAMRALQYEVSRCQVERAIQQQREISDLVAVHVGFDKRVAA